jgi:hypothetical protein
MDSTIKRKKSSTSKAEKIQKEKEGEAPKSTMKRGESFNEAVTPAIIKSLTKRLERSSSITTEESPRKPALPTPAPTAPHSRKPSKQKPIDWVEEYRIQAEKEQQSLQRLFTQEGDVEVSVSNDCDIAQMTVYKGVDAKIPQGKITSDFIVGDGNCGFRSIAYCLFEDQELHYSIRTAACNAIKRNAASFINKVEGLNSTGTNISANQSVEDYLADKTIVAQHAGQIERWCDENLLEGAALAYSTQIRINTRYNGEDVLLVLDPMNVTAGKSIAIVQNGGHYEVLIDDILDDGAADEEIEVSVLFNIVVYGSFKIFKVKSRFRFYFDDINCLCCYFSCLFNYFFSESTKENR